MGYQKRSTFRELFFIVVILGCMGLIGFSIFNKHGLLQLREKEAQQLRLEADIARMREENRLLRSRVDRLQNDQATIEGEIRRKLPLAKPGEAIYQVAEPEPAKPAASTTP